MNRRELIDELNDEYRSLLELVQDFAKDDFEKPGAAGPWSTREVFAHLALWNDEARKAIGLALRGQRPDPWLVTNIEEINAREAAARRNTPLPRVMDDFRRSQRELVAQIEAAAEGQLARETNHKAPDGSNANAAWVAADVLEHLRTHGEELDIWLHASD